MSSTAAPPPFLQIPPGAQRVFVEWWFHPPIFPVSCACLCKNFFEMMFICWIDDKSSCLNKTAGLRCGRHFSGCLKKHPEARRCEWLRRGLCGVLANNLSDLNFKNKQSELEVWPLEATFAPRACFHGQTRRDWVMNSNPNTTSALER